MYRPTRLKDLKAPTPAYFSSAVILPCMQHMQALQALIFGTSDAEISIRSHRSHAAGHCIPAHEYLQRLRPGKTSNPPSLLVQIHAILGERCVGKGWPRVHGVTCAHSVRLPDRPAKGWWCIPEGFRTARARQSTSWPQRHGMACCHIAVCGWHACHKQSAHLAILGLDRVQASS